MNKITNSKKCFENDKCGRKSDEEIVKLALKNQECFACLARRYEEKLLRYIKRISNVTPESAEDLLQEIFLKTFLNLDSFDPRLKFSSWVYRIAHNETINFWRRNKKRSDQVSWDQDEALKNYLLRDEDNGEERVYQKMASEDLLKKIKTLDKKYQTVLILNLVEGKSYKEISREIKKPVGTVGTLIHRAKKKLKTETTSPQSPPSKGVEKR